MGGAVMAYGSVLTDTVQSSTAGTPPQFNDGNGTQVGTLCRAWVNFNGPSGGATINGSFNVSSVTRISTGTYKVTMVNALADANYSAVATAAGYPAVFDGAFSQTSSAVQFYVFYASSTGGGQTKIDVSPVAVSIFR
jgi:hypothetical protein